MAIMSEKQQEIINKLAEAREDYDTWEQALAQEVSDRKWQKKEVIRDLVREARGEEIPYRQIGFALKTSDHRSIKDYEHNRRRDV